MAAILQIPTTPKPHHFPLSSTLFSSSSFTTTTIQTRWKKKPANTAQTRIQDRTRDPRLDPLATLIVRFNRILNLHRFLSARKRGPFVSLRLLSKWAPHVGLPKVPVGEFLTKYPHVFDVFTHPVRKNECFKFRPGFVDLLEEEDGVVRGLEFENMVKIKKILMMSVNGSVHFHALRLTRREFGLPENFRECIIEKYDNVFRLVDLEVFELVNKDFADCNEDSERSLGVAEVEKWREREFREKWLSEFEVKYAFSMNFPTGFKKEPGFKEKLKNWQRLSYVKPYEKMEVVRGRSRGGIERYEKRAVAVIHELLCLTVEKMVEVQKLVHFRKDLGFEVNIRELLLKHPGIFYLSTKGNSQMVFLRESYRQGCLVEPNQTYEIRRKFLDLILLGQRSTRILRNEREIDTERHDETLVDSEIEVSDDGYDMTWNEIEREANDDGQNMTWNEIERKFSDEKHTVICIEKKGEGKDGAFIIPFLESFVHCVHDSEPHKIVDPTGEELTGQHMKDSHFER